MPRLHTLAALVFLGLLTGCPSDTPAPTPDVKTEAPTPDAPPVAVAEAVHEVRCGCKIPEVKKCSEWVKVDGAFIPLTNHGLPGAMPFCGKTDLKAKVAGEIKGGKLVASKVEVLSN